MPKVKSKSRSGTMWTEADYRARGYVSLKIRFGPNDAELLELLASQAGISRTEMIARALKFYARVKEADRIACSEPSS